MIFTLILSAVMMAGLFLLLLAGVGFIQDKKFFASAPKEVQEAIQPRKERFPGAHILGWLLAVVSVVLMGGAVVFGGIDGIGNHFTFLQFFIRFLVMLWLLKAFDILFFDWFLLCRSGFFSHFYPEVKELLGTHLFGFNKKSHVIQIIACMMIALVLAGIFTLIG